LKREGLTNLFLQRGRQLVWQHLERIVSTFTPLRFSARESVMAPIKKPLIL
jgi:hypothetical protein